MPSGSWVPRDKVQERTGCLQLVRLPMKHTCVQLSTNFGNSTTATAYQTFSLCTQPYKTRQEHVAVMFIVS